LSIIVEKMGLEDIDELIRWRMTVLREVFSIPEDEDTTALEAENRRYYERQLEADAHTAVIARENGETALGCGGICYYQEMPSPDNPNGLCAYLMNIYVVPGRRHEGIAQDIVSRLIADARTRGVTKIYLETSEDGRKLYHDLGFRPMEDYLKWEPLK